MNVLDSFLCEDCAHSSRFHRQVEGANGRHDPFPCGHSFCSCPHFKRPPGYMDAFKRELEIALFGRARTEGEAP